MTIRPAAQSLLLTATTLLSLATSLDAAELYVVRDGRLVHTALDWPEGFCRRDIGWRALP